MGPKSQHHGGPLKQPRGLCACHMLGAGGTARGSRTRAGNTGPHWLESWLCPLWACFLSCKGSLLMPPSHRLL